jgi:Homeodomain-like domain
MHAQPVHVDQPWRRHDAPPHQTRPHQRTPTGLTPERRARLLELIEDGNHATTACAIVGISRTTFYNWLNRGEDAAAALAEERDVDLATEGVFVDFVVTVTRARAHAERNAVDVIQRSMRGGFVLSEEPIVNADGDVVCHPSTGEPLFKRSFAQPDGRLALEYLARARPQEWSRQQAAAKVEVSGPEGGPVQVEQQVVIASLAERVAAVVAAREADRELEAAEADGDGVYGITSGGGEG